MTAPNLTMAQAAEAAGLSYDRFRKVWPELVRCNGLPAPLDQRSGYLHKWDPQAVAAWREARNRAGVRDRETGHAADDRQPAPSALGSTSKLNRERAEMAALMRGAAS